jgi:hypothetical protein
MIKRIISIFISLWLLGSICKAENNLQLSIKVDKKSYNSGDYITIEYTFINTGKDKLALCVYDIEHRIKVSTIFELSKNIRLKLKDWTKRKMPIVTKDDFNFLKTGEKHKIEIAFKTVLDQKDTWRYIKASRENKYSWREGDIILENGTYEISCNFINIKEQPVKNAWTGNISSNAINIEIK